MSVEIPKPINFPRGRESRGTRSRRVRFHISEKTGSLSNLDYLKETSGIGNDAEVIRDILPYVTWVVNEILDENTVGSLRPDGTVAVYGSSRVLSAAEAKAKEKRANNLIPEKGTPVEKLDLPNYLTNRLIRNGITTVELLSRIREIRLGHMGVGEVSRKRIRQALENYNASQSQTRLDGEADLEP